MRPARQLIADVLSLAKGTVLAQLVFVVATPALTRIYSPEQLGTFGVYAALVLILGKLVGFRYELAIPLPTQDRIASNLVLLTAALTVPTLILMYVGYYWAAANFDLYMEHHELHDFVLSITMGVAAFVINEALVVWAIRKKQFDVIAMARVINAVSLAVLQLAGFLFGAPLIFLIASYPLALFISTIYQLSKMDLQLFTYAGNRLKLFRILLYRYREFPLYATSAAGLFELSQALPLFILTYFFGNQQAGYFFLARRIGLMPISLVGRAIAQVNHADMLEHHKRGSLGEVMLVQMHYLQWMCIVPATLIAFYAPLLSEILFGEGWRAAGVFMQLLTPYVVIRFIFSPMMAINYVAEWQKSGFWFEVGSSVVSAGCLVWYSQHGDVVLAVASYFLVLAVVNLGYRLFLMKRLGVGPVRLFKPALLQLPVVAGLIYIMHLAAA
ncbi:MAG: hypothetical protein HKN42_10035 [Granulosicoccus sp.]|nr:hypothetical protein [Granulosicoccus sp.]